MIRDYIKYAFGTFKQRKMRTLLTMIGIFIGIAAVVSLVSLGQGLQKTVTEQFEMLGVDKIIIYPGQNMFAMGSSGSIELKEKDLNVVKKTRDVNLVGGMTVKIAKTKFRDETQYTWVSGLPQDG